MNGESPEVGSAVLNEIGRITREVVESGPFVGKLADAIAARMQAGAPALPSVAFAELQSGMVAVDAKAVNDTLVLLTRVRVTEGQNFRLVVVPKSLEALQMPSEAGKKLENYTWVIYEDQPSGDLAETRLINFHGDWTYIDTELRRQLEDFSFSGTSFFYLQLLNVQTVEPPAAG